MFDFKNPKFKEFISENLSQIVDEAVQPVLDNPKFQILRNNLLLNFWEGRANKSSLFAIQISNDAFDKIDISKTKTNLSTTIEEELRTRNFLMVDSEFNIVSSETKIFKSDNEHSLIELSKTGYSVFFFGVNGIDDFVAGTKRGENIFYSDEEIRLYHKKKSVKELDEVFAGYRSHILRKKDAYGNFFAQKPTLKSIWKGKDKWKQYTYLLRNTPESWMRDNLYEYLTYHLSYYIHKENELPSGRKLDIYFEAEGKFYFFEIKWLGNCLNDDGTGISTTDYSGVDKASRRAREGVKQTLEYVDELLNVVRYNVQTGFLVVFDARINESKIQYDDEKLPDELKIYLQHFSRKYDDLKIINSQPG